MSKQPSFTLAGLAGAVLALSVLGCRNDDHTNRPDELHSPPPSPAPSDSTPPLVEDEDEIGDQDEDVDDARGSLREVSPAGGDDIGPGDPDRPEDMVPPPSQP